MIKFQKEDLAEVLPTNVLETKALTTKQKIVLCQLCMLNGLEHTKNNGYFFRSNRDLASDCGITEMTLLSALKKIEALGFIERKQGKRGVGASEYKVNETLINDYYKNENYSKDDYYKNEIIVNDNTINYSKDENYSNDYYKNENYSTDTDTDSYNNLLDITSIRKEEKEKNNTISNITISTKKEKEIYSIAEAEAAVSESRSTTTEVAIPTEVEVLDNTSVGVPTDGDTSEGKGDTATPTEADTNPIGDDAFPAPTTAENTPSGTTTHQDGEKPLQGQEMPSNGFTVQYPCGEVTFRNKEEHKFFDQVGVLLKRLEDTEDDTQFTVKLGKFRKWLLDRGIRKETFDGEILRQVVANREEAKKFRRIERQRRMIGWNDRPMW